MGFKEFVDTEKEKIDKLAERKNCSRDALEIGGQMMSNPSMSKIGRSFTEARTSPGLPRTVYECLETPFEDFKGKKVAIRQVTRQAITNPEKVPDPSFFEVVAQINGARSEVYATVRPYEGEVFRPIDYNSHEATPGGADQEVAQIFSTVAEAVGKRIGALPSSPAA